MLTFETLDEFIISKRSAVLFGVSTLLTAAVTAMLIAMNQHGVNDTNGLPFRLRLPIGIIGMLGTVGTIHIFFGMWTYWARLDRSGKVSRRMWFVILLLGWWFASCLYYYAVYLPQVIRVRETS